jgi:hypothetical protein
VLLDTIPVGAGIPGPYPAGGYSEAAVGHVGAMLAAAGQLFIAVPRDGGDGLIVLDLADPAHPKARGEVPAGAFVSALAVAGDRLYAGGGGLGVLALDPPAAPQPLGVWHETDDVLVDLATTGGQLVGIVMGDPSAEQAGSRLVVFDVADPANPGMARSVDIPARANGLALQGATALVAADDGLRAIDVAGIAADRPADTVAATRGWVEGVALDGDTAYLADAFRGIVTVDLADPSAPRVVSQAGSPSAGLALAEDGIYSAPPLVPAPEDVDAWVPLRLERLARTESANGPLAGGVDIEAGRIDTLASDGRRVYVGTNRGEDEIVIVERGSVIQPRSGEPLTLLNGTQGARALAPAGDRLYVGTYGGWFGVADVADPAAVELVGGLTLPGPITSIATSGDRAFVTSQMPAGLDIVDVADATAPQVVGHFDQLQWPAAVAVSDDIAYVADVDGLHVVDVHSSGQPVELARVPLPSPGRGVAVAGHLAVVTYGDGLVVLDIGEPAAARIVGRLQLPG